MLGSAAMVLSFDIEPAAAVEHDEWHTREHLPERLAIDGFLRGSRWRALEGLPRYLVVYEVAELAVLSSAAYQERLNNPTPWTRSLMKSYRDMRRGFCRLEASVGSGLGCATSLVRFAPAMGREEALRAWLTGRVLPQLAESPGFAGAYLLRAAATPAMTAEQEIRGRDHGLDWVLLAMSHRVEAMAKLDPGRFVEPGAAEPPITQAYGLQYAISREDLATSPAPLP